MHAIFKVIGRVGPPFLVALLYVDLFTSPFVARMGVSNTGTIDPRSLPPEEVKALADLSDSRFGKGQYQKALEPTLRLYNSYPENAVYLHRLADIYHRLGRYPEEAATWEQFLQHAPVPIEGCPQIGQAYEKQGKKGEAIKAYERCLTFEATDVDSMFSLAHALEKEQQYERAESLYSRCATLSPKTPDCLVGKGRVLFRRGRPEEAAKIAAEVLARSPDNTDAMLVIALVDWSDGRLADARRILERAVQLADRYADLYLILGHIAERQGDLTVAAASYAHVLKLDPDNLEVPRRWLVAARSR